MTPLILILVLATLGAIVLSKKSSTDANQGALDKAGDAGDNQGLLGKILQPSSTVKASLASSTDPYVLVAPGIYRLTDAGLAVLGRLAGGWRGDEIPSNWLRPNGMGPQLAGASLYRFRNDGTEGSTYAQMASAPNAIFFSTTDWIDDLLNGKSYGFYAALTTVPNLPGALASAVVGLSNPASIVILG